MTNTAHPAGRCADTSFGRIPIAEYRLAATGHHVEDRGREPGRIRIHPAVTIAVKQNGRRLVDETGGPEEAAPEC